MAADPQLVQFFNACYKDDIETVDMLMHLSNKSDPRETNADYNIFKSFYGIHYACFGRAEHVLDTLLPQCYNYTTQGRIIMHFPFVSTTSNMILNEDSDILQICSISNFTEGANKILAFLQGKGKPYKHKNVCGQTVLHFASINNNEVSKVLLRSRMLLPLWGEVTYGKRLSFLAYAAYLGRAQVFYFIRELFDAADDEQKSVITTQMLYTDDSFGDLEKMAYQQLDNYDKMGTSKEEKSKTALACNFLCKKVLVYAMENEKKFRKVIKKWDAKCDKLGYKSQTEFLRKYAKLDKQPVTSGSPSGLEYPPDSNVPDTQGSVTNDLFSKRQHEAEEVIKCGVEKGNKGPEQAEGYEIAYEGSGSSVADEQDDGQQEGEPDVKDEQPKKKLFGRRAKLYAQYKAFAYEFAYGAELGLEPGMI